MALGGTDVNTFMKTNPAVTEGTMDKAHALVCLHDLTRMPCLTGSTISYMSSNNQPCRFPGPASHQSGTSMSAYRPLRDEKDPFRTALAASMPKDSLRVVHLARPTSPMGKAGSRRNEAEPALSLEREVPAWRVRREYARTQLMVISSNQEGGANVVSEAVVAGVPVIASDIPAILVS